MTPLATTEEEVEERERERERERGEERRRKKRDTMVELNGALLLEVLLGFVLLFVLLLSKSLVALIRKKYALRLVPMAPESVPIFGHALTLMNSVPWDKFCEWKAKVGPVVRVNIMHKELILIDDPPLLKQVFQSRMQRYSKDVDFSYYPFMPLLGTGLVTAEGHLWRRQRSMVSVHFRVEILDEIVGISMKGALRLSEKLEAFRGKKDYVPIAEEFRHLTLQVIGEAILSMSHTEADRVFPLLYLPIMEEANKRSLRPWREYMPNGDWFRHKKRISDLDNYIKELLRKRWNKRFPDGSRKCPLPAEDIIDRIMDDVAKQQGDWNKQVEMQLCYEIKTFMLAGHETSAAMLAWALYELTQNPRCMEKVKEEAEKAFPKDGSYPTKDAISGMDYTYAVLKEALRKYSVVPVVTRVTKQEDTLYDYKIPKGTTIGLLLQSVHHREDIWPDPDQFKPERFLETKKIEPYTFLPFIDGPRNCLGQHLALLEGRVILAYLAKTFNFRTFTDNEGEKASLVVPIAPLNNMRMLVE